MFFVPVFYLVYPVLFFPVNTNNCFPITQWYQDFVCDVTFSKFSCRDLYLSVDVDPCSNSSFFLFFFCNSVSHDVVNMASVKFNSDRIFFILILKATLVSYRFMITFFAWVDDE